MALEILKNIYNCNIESPKFDIAGVTKEFNICKPGRSGTNSASLPEPGQPWGDLVKSDKMENWCDKKMDCLLLLIPLKNSIGHTKLGDFEKAQNGLIKRSKKSGLIYSGVQIIKHSVTQKNKKTIFSLNETWDELIEKERLYGIVYNGNWADVGSMENLHKAEKLLE